MEEAVSAQAVPHGVGDAYRTVGDYYADHADAVHIEDVSQWLSELAGVLIQEPESMLEDSQ